MVKVVLDSKPHELVRIECVIEFDFLNLILEDLL